MTGDQELVTTGSDSYSITGNSTAVGSATVDDPDSGFTDVSSVTMTGDDSFTVYQYTNSRILSSGTSTW